MEADGEESWTLFYDDRYKGKISWWDSPLENFVIWGYVNGVEDPWKMADELAFDEAQDFLMSKSTSAELLVLPRPTSTPTSPPATSGSRMRGQAPTSTPRTPSWTSSTASPRRGRLGWNCGFVLMKDTENYRHAHEFMDAWSADRLRRVDHQQLRLWPREHEREPGQSPRGLRRGLPPRRP